MRNKQKEELLEMLQILQDAMAELEGLIAEQNDEAVLELLADCQNAAVVVGNTIEEAEQQETKAVSKLEELCELIYNCSQENMLQEQLACCTQMKQKLLQIKEEIVHGIKTQKLAVFLPYKASMWDSLESVWKKLDEDEEWITVVMPIPYFAKNADNSLGEMFYEGQDFPVEVPITDWQQFSLEQERPDAIYIHNPYDQFNAVTMVHPLFFASKIKDYTDKLVYIPYFIHQNDMVWEHYCVLPGTIYADVVVLQSEKVRQQYIRYFEEGLPELAKKLGRKALEDKFQALGSPKFDAIRNNASEIPEEWKEFLGNGEKKVIFFNTHLKALSVETYEQFLQKMEWVFRFFQKRENIVLLWRPHPLMLETAYAMNPQAVEPYEALVQKYRQEKIGIYDDSKDLQRAVKLADAYYGDTSSVVELFKHLGKPVMIMNYWVMEE